MSKLVDDYRNRSKPKRLEVEPGVVFQVRPMASYADWANVLRSVPTLPSPDEKPAEGEPPPVVDKMEENYRRTYEGFVDGLVTEDGTIVKIPYEEVLAGHLIKIGEYVLEISGIAGPKALSAGRSLQS